MTVSPLTAFVADSATGSGTIEGYVVQETFSVILTKISGTDLNFELDPQVLLGIKNNTYYGSETADSIIPPASKSTSSPIIYATNKSSYPVLLYVDASMTNDATHAVTFVTESATVNDGTNLNVYFTAVPAQITKRTYIIVFNDTAYFRLVRRKLSFQFTAYSFHQKTK